MKEFASFKSCSRRFLEEGGSRGGRGAREMLAAEYCDSFKPRPKLKSHAGWSGWTRPPTMEGVGRGVATSEQVCKRAGWFLEGSEPRGWLASAN